MIVRRAACVVWALVCVLPALWQLVEANRDFYAILGLERDADDAAIKRAYRKLSLQYHPDKTKNDADGQKKFQEVSEAYEVLSNEEKRQIYDIHGEDGLKKQNQPASPFDAFFGGGGGGGMRKGPNFEMKLPVTLEEVYNGAEKSFNVKRNILCKKCRGTGAEGGETQKCKACKGQGVVMKLQQLGPGFNVQMQAACDKCGGKGKTFKVKCKHCDGNKVYMEEKPLTAIIEKGMPDGHSIVFERASEQSPETIPGDVVLKVDVQKHHRFVRKGNDLHHDLSITLRDALLGFTRTIRQLDGRDVVLTRTGVTPPDHVQVIKGEGMPHHEYVADRGDMFVRITVVFPSSLTDSQQAQVKALLG